MRTSISYISPLAIILVAMQTVCCTGEEGPAAPVAEEKEVPMVIAPVCETTKATHGIEGTVLPDDYVIWAAAYINETNGIFDLGDYFKSKKFVKAAGKTYWEPETPVYWPLGSALDMLTIAVKQGAIDFTDNIRWNNGNCTKGAALSVADTLCRDSEILYSSATCLTLSSSTIPMSYKHAQTWLCFQMECDTDGVMVLDSIMIENIFGGGKLEISREDAVTAGELCCEWNFRGYNLMNVPVPLPASVADRTLGTTPKVFDILLPWQGQGDITFYLHNIHGSCIRYTYEVPARYWYDGTRYTYQVKSRASDISIGEVTVTDWGGEVIYDVNM